MRGTSLQDREQEYCEELVGQVVNAELALEAIDGLAVGGVHDAGIINEDVELAAPRQNDLAALRTDSREFMSILTTSSLPLPCDLAKITRRTFSAFSALWAVK